MIIGYARVSTDKQQHALQIDALKAAGCERIVEETASGAQVNRPELVAMLSWMREGDVLVVWKLDRLARSMKQLIDTVMDLDRRGIQFKCLTQPIDTTTPVGKLTFHIFGALAEFERGQIIERVNAGLKAAKARGVKLGASYKLSRTEVEGARTRIEINKESRRAVARELGVDQSTLWRAMKNEVQYPRAG